VQWNEVMGSVVKCSVEKGWKRGAMGWLYMGGKLVRTKDWGNKRVCNMVTKTLENYIQYSLHLVLYSLCAFLVTVFVLRVLLYIMFICCKRILCVCCISCVFVVSHVYLLYLICCTSYVYLLYCVYCCSYFRCRTAG
jgi:hypothetical protein